MDVKDDVDSRLSVTFACIVPTYRRPLLLERALKSLAMTKNDEIIVIVDDEERFLGESVSLAAGSIDGVRVISTGGRLGGAGARNLGMLASRCEFVIFLDDDDEALPDRNQVFRQEIERYRRQHGVLPDTLLAPVLVRSSSDAYVISEKECKKRFVKPDGSFDFYGNLRKFSRFQIGGVCVRREHATGNLFMPKLKKFQDTQFVLDVTYKSNVAVVDIPVSIYDLHMGGGVSFNLDLAGRKKDIGSFSRLFAHLLLSGKMDFLGIFRWSLRCAYVVERLLIEYWKSLLRR
ncbi:glycosyltransferase [Mesorhizobium sp. M1403]|uniref:glycosyltransferase family 2 protein n=1 Tax=Mesorhizobium sp. M1403 TaxID=2957097 RepID=UPI00333D5AF9